MWDSLLEPEINTLHANIDDLRRLYLGDGPQDFEDFVKGDEKYAAGILRSLAQAATRIADALDMEPATQATGA